MCLKFWKNWLLDQLTVDLFPCVSINPWSAVDVWWVYDWGAVDQRSAVHSIGWLMVGLDNWSNDWRDDWFWVVVNSALVAHSSWNMLNMTRYMVFWSKIVGQWKTTMETTIDTTWGSNGNGNEDRQHQLIFLKIEQNFINYSNVN